MPLAKINDTVIRRAVDASTAGEAWLWDEDLAGFGARIAAGRATFVVKYQIGGRHGRQRKVKLGTWGALNAREARADAKRYCAALLGAKTRQSSATRPAPD